MYHYVPIPLFMLQSNGFFYNRRIDKIIIIMDNIDTALVIGNV